MAEWQLWIESSYGISPDLQNKLIYSLAVLAGLGLLRFALTRLVNHRIDDIKVRFRWQKIVSYIFYALILLLFADIWLIGINNLVAYLGLLSAGLAVALRDPVVNFFGWIFIVVRQPFGVGDRIQIGDSIGDVIDIRLFQFSLLEIGNWVQADQSTGRILHVPNQRVFTETVANYSSGFPYIWNEIPVRITFESDWEKTKGLLRNIVEGHSERLTPGLEKQFKAGIKRYAIQYGVLTPTVYTKADDYGVVLTMRYLCPPLQRRNSEQEIWEAVLRAFHQHADVNLAYPTQRLVYIPETPVK